MNRDRRAGLGASTALLVLWICAIAAGAGANAVAPPDWSGMDARGYLGPIPPEGDLISFVPLDDTLSVSGAGTAFRVLYSAPNQHGAAAVSTAAVFLPHGEPPPDGWPVIAWAHGTVGLGDDCTPSAHPRSERDDAYLSHWLDEGYAVVGTDYVGLGTPGLMSYLNANAQAHSVIDSVRAIHQMQLPLSPKWAIVGQSQGGGAAINSAWWASKLTAGTGLDYRGVVATGTPANIERVVIQAGPDLAADRQLPPAAISYATYIIAGLREARPDIPLDSVLTPRGRELVDTAETVCKRDMDHRVGNTTVGQLFAAPVSSLPGVDAALSAYMATPTSGYDRPIFLGQGLQDTDVPAVSTLTLHQQLVDNNQNVELYTYPEADHSGTVLASIPDSTRFLRQVMAS